MKVKNILIAQPEPANSPYSEIISKYGVKIDFFPFFRIEPLPAKDFRSQRINILDYTAIVFTSKAAIDAFFKLAEELRISIPETMKYFCATEAIALYLQKHIVYRKRKIFFGNGPLSSIIDAIGIFERGLRKAGKHGYFKPRSFRLPIDSILQPGRHKIASKHVSGLQTGRKHDVRDLRPGNGKRALERRTEIHNNSPYS